LRIRRNKEDNKTTPASGQPEFCRARQEVSANAPSIKIAVIINCVDLTVTMRNCIVSGRPGRNKANNPMIGTGNQFEDFRVVDCVAPTLCTIMNGKRP
jgi:hypothetical protein